MKAYRDPTCTSPACRFTAQDKQDAVAQFRRTTGCMPTDADYARGADRHPLDLPQTNRLRPVSTPAAWRTEPLPPRPTHDRYGVYLGHAAQVAYDRILAHVSTPTRDIQGNLVLLALRLADGSPMDESSISMFASYWRSWVADEAMFRAFLSTYRDTMRQQP